MSAVQSFYGIHHSFIISVVILILALPSQIWTICKVKPRNLDSIALFLIFSYMSVFILRAAIFTVYQFVGDTDSPLLHSIFFSMINMTQILVWISLSIFVFKMQAVSNKLQSETPEEFAEKELINRKKMIITVVALSIYLVFCTIYDIITDDAHQREQPYITIDGILRVSKFIIDVYLYISFVRLYIYFFKLKKEQLNSQKQQET